MNREQITRRLGVDWETINQRYQFKSRLNIRRALDLKYPGRSNAKLATAIHTELSKLERPNEARAIELIEEAKAHYGDKPNRLHFEIDTLIVEALMILDHDALARVYAKFLDSVEWSEDES
jgi:hypothetical protein